RVAVFYQDDDFGKQGLTQVEWALRGAGATLVASASYERFTTKVEAAVNQIKEASPHAVILISDTLASAEFLKQSRAAHNTAQMMVMSETD
ncbi:ABC transporter substrate-binding protein, partial [Enterococcus faecium]|uniref:ABC transporter substrate-binding protein n=1 Tax=Enterococcus faecium TaxID=1352 RepID=UPI003F4268BE